MFAGYTILRRLGTGGMGEVYLAQHPRLPRRDALKILPAHLSADREFRERFSREAALAAQLSHPNIIGIHDRGEARGRLWISMDYVPGTDAAQLLRHRYPSGMPRAEVVEIVTAVADALDYAHARGLLHRDVKPANILLGEGTTRGRRIMLADFGIARHLGDISGLTATNMMVGTTAYCAPEQLTGADTDGRADQYALGCTAFHLLTGSPPFPHSNPAVVISGHLSAPPPPIGERRPELACLNAVFGKALAKDPGDRYPSCSDFAAALTGASPGGSSQGTPPRRRRRPAMLIPVIATVALIAAAAVLGTHLVRHAHSSPSGVVAASAPAPPIRLSRYITDQSGVLTASGRATVQRAIDTLYLERNVRLWVVYVSNFAGLRPIRWAEETMRANGLTDTDALLAIATDERHFSFRVPAVVAPPVSAEAIRRDRIEPAVSRGEWVRAALGAADGLQTRGG